MAKSKEKTKVPPMVMALIFLSSLSSVGYGYLMVAISAYLPEVGISSADVGLLMGTSGAAMVASAIPFGLISDRYGRKWILIFGNFLLPPTLFVYALTTDVSLLLVAAIIAGIAEGAILSSWNALIADNTTVDNRHMAFSLSFLVQGSSTGLGFLLPFFFPFFENAFNISSAQIHAAAFFILGMITLMGPLLLWNLLRNYKDSMQSVPWDRTRLGTPSMKRLKVFSINNFLIGLGAGFIIPLIATWMFVRYGTPDQFTGPMLAITSISIGFSAFLSTRVSERLGPVKAIAVVQLSSTVFMVAIPFMPDPYLASIMYFIRSALMNMAGPILDSFLMTIVDKEDRGLASAINSIIWRLPNSVSTIAGGVMLASGMLYLPFFIAASLYVVAITAFYINFRPKPEAAKD
jgi:MFS family permease